MSGIKMVLAFLSMAMLAPLYASAAFEQAEEGAARIGADAQNPASNREADGVVQSSARVIEKLQDADRRIPAEVLRQAAAVAVFPPAGLRGSADGGSQGILVARHAEGWSLPIFVNYSSQDGGAQSVSDLPGGLVLVFRHTETIRQLAEGFDFILGADASITADPSDAAAIPGAQTAQIVAYAPHSSGFDGRTIQGATLTLDGAALEDYYRLNQDAVREYFGEEEQLIRQFLGLDQEINANAQGIDTIPESAQMLQQRLRELSEPSE